MADNAFRVEEKGPENNVKLKYTSTNGSFFISDSSDSENISLQEAFKRYREAKQDELRQARLLRKRQELRKADPHKMASLRQKFLNQAKKYYGYPYAKKYWPPDSAEYNSKLFLDCCGLVRRVMRDLADDFGFILGPWNQAYMYDTLPVTVESEKDMKPGDLVFISATYYNPKSKKQRHNMTHVEIWAGEGCKTVGARWNNGKVQMWDSYKFVAKSYHSETYIFKSIDTWLKGICRSFCPQHSWKRQKYSPSKKSIFALPEQIDEDEAAGDDDDNVDSFTVRGNTFCNQQLTGVSKMLAQCKVNEPPRPKTELDLPSLPRDSCTQVDFPVIRNDLKGKGKGMGSKKRKARGSGEHKVKGKSNKAILREKEDDAKLEVSSVIGWGTSTCATADTGEADAQDKEQAELSMTGSISDLGRKGFYLRDLVDSQKAQVEHVDSEEDSDDVSEDDDEDEVEKEEENEENGQMASGKEEDDFDDDYFVFVKEEFSDDDTELKGENIGQEQNDDNISDDSSEFIMGEDIESEDEKQVKIRNAERQETSTCWESIGNRKNVAKDNKPIDKDLQTTDAFRVVPENSNVNGNETNSDGTKEITVDGSSDQVCNERNSLCVDNDAVRGKVENKEEKKITAIEHIMPFSVDRVNKSVVKGNLNQNANTKTNEKSQTNKHEKGRSQCLKASIVTIVSQTGPSGSEFSISQANVLPSSQMLHSGTHSARGCNNLVVENQEVVKYRGGTGYLVSECQDVTLSTESRSSSTSDDQMDEKSATGAC